MTSTEREIAKWEKERAKPKRNHYFAYMVFVITLIYMTDEIASQIGTLMKTEIAGDLLASFGASSVGMLDILGMVVVPFQLIGLVYKPLADKWGRKKFLVINTFGMSLALLIIFLSDNLVLYFLGACLIQFFIPHDMHVVYIMETAPAKHRARVYACIKCKYGCDAGTAAAQTSHAGNFPMAKCVFDSCRHRSCEQFHSLAFCAGDGRFYRCPSALPADVR